MQYLYICHITRITLKGGYKLVREEERRTSIFGESDRFLVDNIHFIHTMEAAASAS